jgi:hypothetical protein
MDKIHPFHAFPPEGIHLYHADKPPIVAHDSETRDKAIADGYTTEYVPKDYPKVVHAEVADAAAQADAAQHGFRYVGDPKADFPRAVSRTFASAEEENGAEPKEAEAPEHEPEPEHPGFDHAEPPDHQ